MTKPVIFLTGETLDIPALNVQLRVSMDAGATASFTGYVRQGGDLTALELQHHPVMTRTALERIAQTAMERFKVLDLLIAHRYGRMMMGEPIVHIATAAPHRRAALEAVSFTIDVLKTQAPFWKREWRGEAYSWVEPTREDHDKATQWMEGKQ
jgi:molybdopterin synthase catalytic subunit